MKESLEMTVGKTDADVTSGSTSIRNVGFMQAKDHTINLEDIDSNIKLR